MARIQDNSRKITHLQAQQECTRNIRQLRDVFLLEEEEMVAIVHGVYHEKEPPWPHQG